MSCGTLPPKNEKLAHLARWHAGTLPSKPNWHASTLPHIPHWHVGIHGTRFSKLQFFHAYFTFFCLSAVITYRHTDQVGTLCLFLIICNVN